MEEEVDMRHQLCVSCEAGRYRENSLHCDWEGYQVCDKCAHTVQRYQIFSDVEKGTLR